MSLTTEPRQQIIADVTAVCAQQGIEADLLNIKRWRLVGLKRIWLKGKQTKTGREVFIKMRLRGASLPAEEFVASETRNFTLANYLNSRGIPSQELMSKQFTTEPEWIIYSALPGEKIGHFTYQKQQLTPALLATISQLRQTLDAISPSSEVVNHLRRQDWCQRWLEEYEARQSDVEKYLGATAQKVCHDLLLEKLELKHSLGIVHTDLSPENILEQAGRYYFLDWGGASYSTKALDWMMVWVFSAANPDFQAKIIDEMLKRASGPAENQEIKKAALKVVARMIATFAEYCSYWDELPDKRISSDTNPHETLASLWSGLVNLQKTFNG